MITCSRCGKENQDHYKFCLGCGAKLERPAAAPARPATAAPAPGGLATASTAPPVTPAPQKAALGSVPLSRVPASSATPGVTPKPATAAPVRAPTAAPAAVRASAAAPVAAAPPRASVAMPAGPAAAPAEATCPKCGVAVKPTNTFCGKCGFRLKGTGSSPGPAAPGGDAPVPRTMYMAAPVSKSVRRGSLTLIRPDGTEGGIHPLVEGENLIGRGQGALFDADPYLSPRHAEFLLGPDGLTVRDLKSLNGVFVRLTEELALDSGSIFRIGQELLRFDVIAEPVPLEDGTEIIGTPNPGYWGRISVIVGRDVDGPAFPIFEESIVLGRERGDILFPEDGYVSATHARIALRDGHVYLQDLGSSNGTFARINNAFPVASGSLLLMGQQLFRVQYE